MSTNDAILPAIVIGHRLSSQGARSKDGTVSEYSYNEAVALRVAEILPCHVVYRDDTPSGYRDLPGKINGIRPAPSFALSLHLNAFNTTASGSEALYYHSSKVGKIVADDLAHRLSQLLGIKNRGGKPKHSEDRGGYLLRYTDMPCVISEPGFVDNPDDLALLLDKRESIARLYADVLYEAHFRITNSHLGDST